VTRPLDFDAIHRARTKLEALVSAHPGLRNPEAQARLSTWLEEEAMKEASGEMRQIFVRMPAEMIAAIDAYAQRLQAEQPWTHITRSEALRTLVYKALAAEHPAPLKNRGK